MASNTSEIDELNELQIALAKFTTDMKHDPEPESANEADMDEFSQYEQEYSDLSSTMDELDEFMTALEKKNDDIVANLQQLLQESREIVKAFQAERMADGNSKPSSENDGDPSPAV